MSTDFSLIFLCHAAYCDQTNNVHLSIILLKMSISFTDNIGQVEFYLNTHHFLVAQRTSGNKS